MAKRTNDDDDEVRLRPHLRWLARGFEVGGREVRPTPRVVEELDLAWASPLCTAGPSKRLFLIRSHPFVQLASDDEPVAVSSDDERPAPKKKPVKKEKAAPSSSKAKPKAKETTSKKASKEKPAPKVRSASMLIEQRADAPRLTLTRHDWHHLSTC